MKNIVDIFLVSYTRYKENVKFIPEKTIEKTQSKYQIHFIHPFMKYSLLLLSSKNFKMDSTNLPVNAFKRQIISAVEQNNALIIVAETGSGKSTQIPQFLHESGLTKRGKIAVTQPRRIGAISVASRVSDEMGCRLGGMP